MASANCIANCSSPGLSILSPPIVDVMAYFEYQPWFFSLLASGLVGLSGVLPLLIIRIDDGSDLKHGASAGTLKMLLSFAVGGLLGDVFLHLLPEAWAHNVVIKENNQHPPLNCGLWVLAGFLVFIIAEKMFNIEKSDEPEEIETNSKPKSWDNNNSMDDKYLENNNSIRALMSSDNGYVIEQMTGFAYPRNKELNYDTLKSINGLKAKNGYESVRHKNGYLRNGCELKEQTSCKPKILQEVKLKAKPIQVAGYLNLVANCIDNFTHGLAVGGSFLISFRIGALTTFAILIHEIPHEVGDFAILLRSGFSRWDAAKAQLITATGGIFGALVAVLFSGDGIESKTCWILPFTAGGFLHIGLVSILPELLKESSPKESLKQLGAILCGIMIMAVLTIVCD